MIIRLLFLAAVLSASAGTPHHMYFARTTSGPPITYFSNTETSAILIDSGDFKGGIGGPLTITSKECEDPNPFLDSLAPHKRYATIQLLPLSKIASCTTDSRIAILTTGDQLRAVNINLTANGSGGYTRDTLYAYAGYNQAVPILSHSPVTHRIQLLMPGKDFDLLGRRFFRQPLKTVASPF